MYVSRSDDGGVTWGPPVYATGDNSIVQNLSLGHNMGHSDRLELTVDNQTGTLYASADTLIRTQRWIVASHDGGKTFGPPHAIDTDDLPETPYTNFIPSSANGVIAANYVTAGIDPSCRCQPIFETSEDDGAHWTRHSAPLSGQWTAADPSHPGRFAIMTAGEDGLSRLYGEPTEFLLVSVTSDYGKTWSMPVTIGQNPPNPRWRAWINYSPEGVLGVGYKTMNGGICIGPIGCYGDSSFEYWAALSYDGGVSFGTPIRISENPSLEPGATGAGDDFSFVGLGDKYLYASWGDSRATPGSSASGVERSVYFARIPLLPPATK